MLPPIINAGDVLATPGGRALLDRWLPKVSELPPGLARRFLIGSFLRVTPGLRDDPAALERFWSELESVLTAASAGADARDVQPVDVADAPAPAEGRDVAPGPVADAPARGTAPWTAVGEPTRWGLLEVELRGPAEGNPFVEVELSAQFTVGESTYSVGGFYDGDGVYRLRALAEQEGSWRFTTSSTAPELDGVRGEIVVGPAEPGAHGPVKVDGFHFAHADGTRYRPWGTTGYAWTYQDDAVQRATLETLADSPFTKIRMCLFPKHYIYNTNEPTRFPFPRNPDGSFDHERFDTEFFAQLDAQIQALAGLGVEADLVLFHPYDHWGFADLGATVDDRVVRYVVRRLAGFANVWFALANEYDLMIAKTVSDWDRIGELVVDQDPHGHLVSIHNGFDFFDHGRPWVTHASIQRDDVEETGAWRERWGKPVVVDECGYEGDIEYDWGNLTGEELVRRIWVGAVRGGYVGHGETYWNAAEELWWSKGGHLHGTSPQRIAFLDQIVAESPTGTLEPLPSDFDAPWAGALDRYLVSYHGDHRPRERHVLLPPGRWRVDVIDTWDCTVDPVPGEHELFVLVPLPAKPFQAVRLVAVSP